MNFRSEHSVHYYAGEYLKQKGVTTDNISKSMDHQNISITQTYLKAFDNSVLNNGIEILV
ncbi:hypothetical protein [Winogradskyella vidalii]|uniref:hypothetical protein n=1 Tax=Winogradskyella vidalii TaxID=2615024 RepID=UPI0015CC1182|nr:hypothetical protein [Winogradskyella vidalii]